MEIYAHHGFSARAGPKAYFVIQGVDVSSVTNGASAQVTICSYNDGATYNIKREGPDGKAVVIGDTTGSGRARYRYISQAGVWKLVGQEVLEIWKGKNRCPAK